MDINNIVLFYLIIGHPQNYVSKRGFRKNKKNKSTSWHFIYNDIGNIANI